MARRSTKRALIEKKEAPKNVNFLTINGLTLSIGDLRKVDFQSLEDPKSSVNSLVAWAKKVNAILKGVSEVES